MTSLVPPSAPLPRVARSGAGCTILAGHGPRASRHDTTVDRAHELLASWLVFASQAP
jgi:hypothetical protein